MANALAYEAGFRDKEGRVCSRPITAGAIQGAREQLILRRETHLDQLADKLQEERVRRVIEPLLSGSAQMASVLADDIQYVRDLGLWRSTNRTAATRPTAALRLPLGHVTLRGRSRHAVPVHQTCPFPIGAARASPARRTSRRGPPG